jgi:hypothetical protein
LGKGEGFPRQAKKKKNALKIAAILFERKNTYDYLKYIH